MRQEPRVTTKAEILNRLTALFTVPDEKAVALGTVVANGMPDGVRAVELDFGSPHSAQDVCKRVKVWLDAPNPAFRCKPPREYLDSEDHEKLEYLGAVLGALEHGAFS